MFGRRLWRRTAGRATIDGDNVVSVDEWKRRARAAETQAKKYAADARELQQWPTIAAETRAEAVAEARAQVRAQVERDSAAKLAAAIIGVACIGKRVDPEAIIATVDVARFTADDGQLDVAGVASVDWPNNGPHDAT